MDSTAKPAPAGAEDFNARGDTRPNADYERVVREELARVQERLAQLAPVGMAAAAPPEVKIAPVALDPNGSGADKLDDTITAFRPADVNGAESGSVRSSTKRGIARILTGLLVAGTIVGAGAAWAAYGEDVKPLIASWTPQVNATWSLISDRLGLSAEQRMPAAPSATADAPAPQTASAQPGSATNAAAPAPADVGQMLQSMARDIAGLQQGIEQLKAGQEQMARDNAKLAEQLKASQEQMSRVMARASEASIHPRPPLPAQPKPPFVAAAHKPPPLPPVSTLPPPQTIAPPAQAQQQAEEVPGAPRPPKPVP
ncbi:MAG TPA: hypothetical protein VKY22_30065 [Bradyrhizobium sp.]|nr:hypothetical protein [Bradyrhizobium sp.]